MKLALFASVAASLIASGIAAAEPDKPVPQILERDPQGRVTKVRLDGQDYAVCTAQGQDGCINPREAGLPTGNVPFQDWPGKTGTEIRATKGPPPSGGKE